MVWMNVPEKCICKHEVPRVVETLAGAVSLYEVRLCGGFLGPWGHGLKWGCGTLWSLVSSLIFSLCLLSLTLAPTHTPDLNL